MTESGQPLHTQPERNGTQQPRKHSAIGQLLDNRYRILQVLGGGAFGKTYLAADLRRPGYPHCVVKQLRLLRPNPTSVKNAHRLFKREAEMLQKLGNHPQIPRLLAYFEQGKQFYLVKEFTPGHPLTEEIFQEERLSEVRTLAILVEVLEVLTFVHAHRVIHRDIKPANLIRRQRDGRLVLIDFGSVKEIVDLENGQAARTIAAGTPAYMPMEQFYGNPQLNSDIYAVGMLSIQALTGLSSEELQKLRGSSKDEAIEGKVSWRHLVQVDPRFADIIDRMVHPSYHKRYQSALEVLEDLQPLLGTDRPLSMTSGNQSTLLWDPDAPQRRPWRWLRREQWGIWVGGGFTLLLLSILTGIPQTLGAQYFVRAGTGKVEPIGLNRQGFMDPADPTVPAAIPPAPVDISETAAYEQAVTDYSRSLQWQTSAAAVYGRGTAYYALGNWQAALADFNQALQWDPSWAIAQVYLGLTRDRLGDRQGALQSYNQAIALDDTLEVAYLERGRHFTEVGNYDAAEADLEQVLERYPRWGEARRRRSQLRLAQADFAGAIADATAAIEADSQDAEAFQLRGAARARSGDMAGAIADLKVAISLETQNADPYYYRAIARSALGEVQGALIDFNQAIRLNPGYAEAYYQRGLIHERLGNRAAAREDFRQSAKLCLDAGNVACYQEANAKLTAPAPP